MKKKADPPRTERELAELYAALRLKYFRDEAGRPLLPPPDAVRIEWSNRVTASAGICYSKQRLIRLSTHYHARFPEEVEATLLHEMIHLIVPGHGPEFYRWMERIRSLGGRVQRYARERALPKKNVKWLYTCLSCRRSYPYTRRLAYGGRNHYCKRCGPRLGRLLERRADA